MVQVLLFYSTLTDKLRDFVPNILPDWKWDRVYVNKEEFAIHNSKMFTFVWKYELLKSTACFEIINRVSAEKQVVIYVNPETDIGRLHNSLSSFDVSCAAEVNGHGVFDQNPVQSLLSFKSGNKRVLITCKPHSIGFDKSMVSVVIFYDLPMIDSTKPDYERYYRLATRVGRNTVCIFNILTKGDEVTMKKIETFFGRTAKKMSPNTIMIESALKEAGMLKPFIEDLMDEDEEDEDEEDEDEEEGEDDDSMMEDMRNDPLALNQDELDDLSDWW
ncbi:DEAD-box ATP-dependent RNA helicase 38 [Tanacetum coccineum]